MGSLVTVVRSFQSWMVIVGIVALAGCGGGGGGSSDPNAGGPGNPRDDDPVAGTVSGTVAKGFVAGGTVAVYELNDDASRAAEPFSSTVTDANGDYDLDLSSGDNRVVAFVVTGGSYVDEATGETVDLAESDELVAYARIPAESAINVTPLTTLAAARVQYLVSSGQMNLTNALTNANSAVSNQFRVENILTTRLRALTDLGGASEQEINYALFLAAFSQLDAEDGDRSALQILKSMADQIVASGSVTGDGGVPVPGELVTAVQRFLSINKSVNVVFSGDVFTGLNLPPVAKSYTVTIEEDGSATFPVLIDVKDPNNDDQITLVRVDTDGTQGAVQVDGSQLVYTAPANFSGSDSFSYVLKDNREALSSPATVQITITPVNDTPAGQEDTYQTAEDTAVAGMLKGSDVESSELVYAIAANPQKGQVQLDDVATGAFTYTPNSNATGADSFTFTVSDGELTSEPVAIAVNITARSDTPVAVDGVVQIDEDSTLADGQLQASDGDGNPLTYTVVSQPEHGALEMTPATGGFTYTPAPNYAGSDRFTFKVTDSDGNESNVASVRIAVAAVADMPVVEPLAPVVIDEDSSFGGQVIAHDADGESVSYAVQRQGTVGVAEIIDAAAGTFRYTANADQFGSDTVVIAVTAGSDTVTTSLNVTVNSVEDLPVATGTTLAVAENSAPDPAQPELNRGVVTATDGDGDTLTFSLVAQPAKGAVVLNGTTGEFTYTPNSDENGSDSFAFVANDGDEDSNVAVVDISIIAVNDSPVAEDKRIEATSQRTNKGRLPATDVDADDSLTFTVTVPPAKGQVTIDADGWYTYTVNGGASGMDSFQFRVQDAAGGFDEGTIDVEIDSKDDSILIIAAHPDDEALMAAGVIADALAAGEPVKVAVLTNGDSKGIGSRKAIQTGYTRQAETINALSILGLAETDVIFLGYPNDSKNGGISAIYNDHPTDAEPAYVHSQTNMSHTYGSRGLGGRDYHHYHTGVSAEYNRENLLGDLVALLEQYRPTRIYTHSTLDEHTDHRFAYYLATEALRDVAQRIPTFTPVVYTTVIHSPVAFSTADGYGYVDKWAPGTKSSFFTTDYARDAVWPAPAFSGTRSNRADMIKRFTPAESFTAPPDLVETPVLWEDRISRSLPDAMLLPELVNNTKFKLIDAYKSQQSSHGLIYAFGKNEEVFWKTDWQQNIAIRAQITASSEATATFQFAQNVADGIIDGFSGNHFAEWSTAKGKSVGETLQFTWAQLYMVNAIRLYDRPLPNKQVTSGMITFSDGTTEAFGALPNDGMTPLTVTLDPARTVDSMIIEITGFSDEAGGTAGFAEVQVLATGVGESNKPPFISVGPLATRYSLQPLQQTALTVKAMDRDGDAVSYSWSAVSGTITGAGRDVTYTAPASAGVDTVTVEVSDGVNPPVTAQFAVRTESPNVAPQATVTVSSEYKLFDQLGVKAIDGVVDGYPRDYTREWVSNGDGTSAWITLTWATPQAITGVRLYDRPLANTQITGGTLMFSDGSTVTVGALPNDGQSALAVDFPAKTVTSVRFQVDSILTGASDTPGNVGLAEIIVVPAAP